jgi:pyruvate formate lyase activating enzyme
MIANYHSIETFSGVDGPGIRYVLFLQGCNMQCKFCHNADTIPNIKNKSITVEEVVQDYLKYKNFYVKGGGITVTGGEPFMQIDFIIELFEALKKHGVHTCIETQGSLFNENEKFKRLINCTDLFLVDLKGVDNAHAKDICGYEISGSFKFLSYLNSINHKFCISYVLLPGMNDDEICVEKLANILKKYDPTNMAFKVLPYHKLGIEKWDAMNIKYQLRHLLEPTKVDVEAFIKRIEDKMNEHHIDLVLALAP